jgi:hypothetical protein
MSGGESLSLRQIQRTGFMPVFLCLSISAYQRSNTFLFKRVYGDAGMLKPTASHLLCRAAANYFATC